MLFGTLTIHFQNNEFVFLRKTTEESSPTEDISHSVLRQRLRLVFMATQNFTKTIDGEVTDENACLQIPKVSN